MADGTLVLTKHSIWRRSRRRLENEKRRSDFHGDNNTSAAWRNASCDGSMVAVWTAWGSLEGVLVWVELLLPIHVNTKHDAVSGLDRSRSSLCDVLRVSRYYTTLHTKLLP